jgi:Arc/MetJ-type ribon-helix-helix transcriptional regulator
MKIQHQIESLRRRYQSGDDSARESLQRLLQAYLYLIVRRAARTKNTASRVARGIQRLTGESRPVDLGSRGPSFPSADEVCRQLCDKLLQTPAVKEDVATVMETFRKAGRKTECFAQVP